MKYFWPWYVLLVYKMKKKREVKTAAAREYLCRQINFEIIGAFCVKLHDMAKDETQKVERGGCPIIQNL